MHRRKTAQPLTTSPRSRTKIISLVFFSLAFIAAATAAAFSSFGNDDETDPAARAARLDAALSIDARPAEALPRMKGGTVYLIPSSGQSNSIGAGSRPVTAAVTAKGNLFGIQGGRKIIRLSEPTISAADPVPRESHVTAMGRMFEKEAASGHGGPAYLFSSHGAGGMQFSSLRKGGSTGSYEDILDTVARMKEVSTRAGAAMTVPYLAFIHGESDASLKIASSYQENLNCYVADLNRDIPGITGQRVPVRVVISQVSSGPGYFEMTNSWNQLWQVKQIQLLMSRLHPNIVLAGPTYQFPLVEGKLRLHFTNEGYQMLGEMLGKTMRYMTETGRKWVPLSPKSVRKQDGRVVIAFNVPVRPLRWDRTIKAPDRGFELFDRAGSVTLRSVSLRDSEVVLIPARPLMGKVRVRYGYRTHAGNPAGGGSLTDSDGTVSPHGFSLRNYCVLFDMSQSRNKRPSR